MLTTQGYIRQLNIYNCHTGEYRSNLFWSASLVSLARALMPSPLPVTTGATNGETPHWAGGTSDKTDPRHRQRDVKTDL